ncbi:hypothetical protein L6164_022820 [Bauhinia variegata]|uniref:Uncharacterized protein n=1 Tax=Bauhinia variegata TaxID=167791 RepID=A0ACB9MHP1_BAUVA|nr:hypothetical protein L6164_022820 [Bauhinia variegata]
MVFLKASILFHLLLLTLSHNLVSADEKLVMKECQNAKVPIACFQCLEADPSSRKTDIKGLAAIMLTCVGGQADIMTANMSDWAATEKDPLLKNMYEECQEDFASAKQEILTAKVALTNNNPGESLKCLGIAFNGYFDCHDAVIFIITRIPKEKSDPIIKTLSLYNDLSEDASSLIESLIHH